jgi:glutamine amidotransferase of anthranilate synthase or aminodeoxychorismate synthase
MILIIDNYDSFTYNLYQYIGEINTDIKVLRNDTVSVEEVEALNLSHIIISPGPGTPSDAGICIELIKKLSGKIPILGVCLGHQAIGEAFGSKVVPAKKLMHGKTSVVYKMTESRLLEGFEDKFTAGRYHSLIVDRDQLSDDLEILAESEEKEIMAMKHKTKEVYGIQFHPESILTPGGLKIIENFLKIS